MQTGPFKDKIEKDHEVIIKELSKFRNSWQGKSLPNDKIQTYCNLMTYLSDLHTTYVNNCMEYFTPAMKQQTLTINKNLIDDLIKKIKHVQSPPNNNDLSLKSKSSKPTCYLCSSKIREIDVKLIKQQLADDASLRKSLMKKMYTDLQNQNASLFTKDEDQTFFKFLNRVLIKKQEVLAMQTQQISDFILEVTKSFSDLNFLTQYTPLKHSSSEYKQNYREEMEKTIADTLKTGFNSKVHPWVHKVFESMKRHILYEKRLNYVDGSQQTEVQIDINKKRSEYAASSQSRKELDFFKQEVQKHISLIDELKAEITVLTKQKKQLEDYYTKELNQLKIGKRSIQLELNKTQTDFFNLKTIKDTQIFQLNKKLSKQRKNTQPNPSTSKQNDLSNQDNTNNNTKKQSAENQNQSETGLRQKQETKRHFKKKKTNLSRLFSNKPEANRGNISNNYKSTTELGLLNSTTHFQNTLNSPSQHYELEENSLINPNETLPHDSSSPVNDLNENINSNQIAEKFLKEIKLRSSKRKSKNTQQTSSTQQEAQKQQQNTSKIQFKLDPLIDCKDKISVIVQESHHQTKTGQNPLSVTGSAPKMSKRKFSQKKFKPQNSQKRNKRVSKRMLSIEMKMLPLIKAGESIYKPKNQQVKFSQAGQVFNTSSSVAKDAISPKKKVFEYVPLQNQQEYASLKQKMNEITSKYQLKNNEKLKQSVRYIKEEISNPDLAKTYGFSVFSKKFSQMVIEKDMSYSRGKDKKKRKLLNRSKDSEQDSQRNSEINGGIIIQNKPTKPKAKSLRYRATSRKDKPQLADYSQQTQTFGTSMDQQLSPIDHIPVNERESLFKSLAKESMVPASLTFHHYEMIVRKLFAEQKSELINEANIRLMKRRVSTLNTEDRKDKQKQSVKINIDAKFFEAKDSNKTHQTLRASHHTSLNHGKLLLNLPKINHSPSVLVSAQHNNSLQNASPINPNLLQAPKKNKSLFHTLRQSRTQLKNENFANGRQKQVKESQNTQIQGKKMIKQENENNEMKQSADRKGPLLSLPENQNMIGDNKNISQSSGIQGIKTSNKIINSPPQASTIIQPLNPKHTHIFSPNDIKLLFESQLTAYEYEQLIKSPGQLHSHQILLPKGYQLSKQDNESIKSLYEVLGQMKQKNSEVYFKVCSFVKSPYQCVRGGFDFINTAKDLSLEGWTQYLTRIYAMRRGSAHNKEKSLTAHKGSSQQEGMSFRQFVKPFEQKLVQLLIMAQK